MQVENLSQDADWATASALDSTRNDLWCFKPK